VKLRILTLSLSKDTNWIIGGTTRAAPRLGMKRTTPQVRLKKLGITHRSKVDIPTAVGKSSTNRRHNPSETKRQHTRLSREL
jgi:hypothetical protein